jgi:glycosyltransferase involved in cell wall biosynthesis
MKVALVYDRVNKWGGAERVLLALHKIFPRAPLYTAVYDSGQASWAKVFKVKPSFLQKISFAKNHHEHFALLMPLVFESFDFSKYDLVISITSEAAKGIITPPETKHICICLTPTRYLWSGYEEYFKNSLFKIITAPIIKYLRKWDFSAAQKPDQIIAISETVQKRIKKYYKRESIIIYPPSELKSEFIKFSKKSHHEPKTINYEQSKGYFLVVSRLSKLTAYKRVDIAIKAANKLGINLVVIGSGRDIEYYKNMAGDSVEFVGSVSDSELAQYYKNAKALLFTGNEDFGLVMVEAQSYGTPVIAYRKGGATEIVREGKTGEFFDRQTIVSLIDVLKSFDNTRYNKNDCIANSKRFSFTVFEKEIHKVVKLVEKS